MAVKFKNGDKVRQILPAPVEGDVVRFVFDETTGEISYVVRTVDADGEHERVFKAEDLEISA
jgi:hypothetical protein